MAFSNDRIRRSTRLPLLIMGGFMVLFYFGLGSYIILNPSFLPKISKDHRTIFGGLLLVYGAYRSWRLYSDHIKS